MRVRRTALAWTVALAMLLLGALPTLAGTIQGTVKYEGKVPNLRPIKMDADPGCLAKHSSPVKSEILVLGDGNTMANIFVQVKSGVPDKSYPVPSEPVVMDQKGCRYSPHVMGIMVGQELKILNSDGLLHNVHALPKVNKQFNMAMPATRTEASEKFTKLEGIFKIKCDVHPWMGAWIAVLDHPFFDVTGKDGKFKIEGLPPGTYEIEAWYEFTKRFPPQTTTVTISGDETKTADFTFQGPPAD